MRHSIIILFLIIFCCTFQKTKAMGNNDLSYALMNIIENYDSIVSETKYAPKYCPSTDTVYYNIVINIEGNKDVLICVDGSKYENYYSGIINPQAELLKEENGSEKKSLIVIGNILRKNKRITIYADQKTEMSDIANILGEHDINTSNLYYIMNFESVIDRDPYVCIYRIRPNMSIQLTSQGKPYIGNSFDYPQYPDDVDNCGQIMDW